MKKNLKFLFIVITLFCLNNLKSADAGALAANDAQILDPSDRPADVLKDINKIFKELSRKTTSGWGLYNGAEQYNLLNINEQATMKQLILEQYPHKKTFYALELGAGEFNWEKGLSEYLNQQKDLPKDITVNIIGVRAETNLEPATIEEGICIRHNLGAFDGNNLIAGLKERGFDDIMGKVDLIITQWALRHFVDPLGTFVQAYNLLQPGLGLFFFDGFSFNIDGKTIKNNTTLLKILFSTQEEFLTEYYDNNRSFNRYVLRRTKKDPLQLPLSYNHFLKNKKLYSGAGGYTVFSLHSKLTEISSPRKKEILYGSKELFNWFLKNKLLWETFGLFKKDHLPWLPLSFEGDERSYASLFPLHQAIKDGNLKEVQRIINAQEEDINQIDERLRTPLALAIEKNQLDIALWIAQQKGINPLFKMSAFHKSPLQLAEMKMKEDKEYEAIVALFPQEDEDDERW